MKSQRKIFYLFGIGLLTVVLLLVGYSQSVSAQDDLVKKGEYLANLCIGCHTPPKAEFMDMTKLQPEQLKALAMNSFETLDMTRKFAGGRGIPLPGGEVLITRNITSDKATGLGDWTDQEIESAIRFGIRKDGSRLHPLMPYRNFNNLATEDVTAIIAFLRSLPAVSNEIPLRDSSADNFPPVVAPAGGVPATAPTSSNKVERGSYLVNALLSCGDCHTPLDQKTGAPIADLLMAGGQPFEGPWGIVYGGNMTPHKETGLGDWTDEEIKRAIVAGIGKDNRRLIFMPWEDYAPLTPDDLDSVVAYMRDGLQPIENTVPPAAIAELFNVKVEADPATANSTPPPSAGSNTSTLLIIGGIVVAILILGGVLIGTRRPKASS